MAADRVTSPDHLDTYNPFLVAVISLVVPGLGQAYLGEYRKGAVIFVALIAAWLSASLFVGFVLGPLVHLIATVDAYRDAKAYNAALVG